MDLVRVRQAVRLGKHNRVCHLILDDLARLDAGSQDIIVGLCQAYAEMLKAVGEHCCAQNLDPEDALGCLEEIHQAVWSSAVSHVHEIYERVCEDLPAH